MHLLPHPFPRYLYERSVRGWTATKLHPRSAHGLQPAPQGTGGPRRSRPSKQRRTLFDDESDGVLVSEAESQPATQGEVRARRDKRSRELDAPSRMARGPQRQPYGEGPGRKRYGSVAAHLQYIRAGKVRERELALLGLLPHHLDTPASPPPSDRSGVCVCVWRACVCPCVCAPHFAPPTMGLHGTCGCASCKSKQASCRDGKLT